MSSERPFGANDTQIPSVLNDHFSALLGKNPLPVFILDVETGNPAEYLFLAANEAACDQYGYTEDEFRNMKMLELHPQEDIQKVLEDVAPSRDSKYEEYSSSRPGRHVKKDGSIIYVDVTSHRINYEGRQARVAIARNITERVLTKKSLTESEERYRFLLDKNIAGVYLVHDDRFIYVNDKLAEMFGYTTEEITGGMGPRDLTVPEDWPRVEENIRNRVGGEIESINHEFRGIRSDGSFIDVQAYGGTVDYDGKLCILGTIIDIGERKEAERKMRESEENLRRMLDAVQDLVYVCNSEYEIDFTNKALAGELHKAGAGKTCYDAVFGRDKPCIGCNLSGVIDGETERYEIENERTGKIYDVVHTPFKKVDGTSCAIHFMRDITIKKNMEEKLKYNYALLETQQEVSPDGILVVDEKGKMVSFNQRFVDMWELPSEIIETSSDEIAINAVLERIVEPAEFVDRVNYLYEHPEEKSREEIRLKDGQVFDRHSSGMFGPDGEFFGRVWFFRDVTEQKVVENELRKSQAQLRATFDSAPFNMFTLDTDGRYVMQNASIKEAWGDVTGKRPEDLGVDEDTLHLWKQNNNRALGGETVEGEVVFKVKGEKRSFYNIITPIRDGDSTYGILGINLDITDRKHAEEKIRQSEEEYRGMFEAQADAVMVIDAEGRLVDCNPVACSTYGDICDPRSGRSFGDIFHPDHRYVLHEAINVVKTEKVYAGEALNISRDGGHIYTSIRITPFIYGGKSHALVVSRDITDRVEAEEALKKAKADLERKNEEMEAFVYTAAHDLRTPLISVRGFLNLLSKKLENRLDEKSEYHLERVMKNAEHFDNLLRDLLQFSQVGAETGQREEINLSAVAREVAYEIAKSYGIEASINVSEKLPIVKMQPSRVYHLLENLITNSVKFKRAEARLELEIGVGDPDDDMQAGHLPIFIRDNGIGIEENIQGEIFGLFSRPAENSEEGTGVGLAIVKRIVEEEGGSIRVDSTPGKGTTFYFSLPCVSASSWFLAPGS